MTHSRIFTTADDFIGIEKAVLDYFKTPLRLIYDDNQDWRVCQHDCTPFGKINSYYVVRQGTRYRLEARENVQPPIVHRRAA